MCISSFSCAGNIFTNMVGGGGVQQQKRSCHREKPKMSFVFFVLICSFAKYVQHRRFCAEVGQNCDLLSSFLFFFVVFAGFGQQNVLKQRTKKNKKIMPPGKLQDVLCLLCCWTPPPLKHETSYYPILILNVISRAVNSKSLLHFIFRDFVKFHCLIQALFFSL